MLNSNKTNYRIRAISFMFLSAAVLAAPAGWSAAVAEDGWTKLVSPNDSFGAWRQPTKDWYSAGDAVLDPKNPRRFVGKDGSGVMINGEIEKTTSLCTKRGDFRDVELHVEFMVAKGSNSGIIFHGNYEIQILDSFDNQTYPDGQCAALYGQCPPLVNACRAAGEWQTYDIVFKAPRYEGETLVRPASATVLHNGICVHADKPFIGPTTHRAVAAYSGTDTTGPIQLQDHGNPVRFRNIWVRELGAYDKQ